MAYFELTIACIKAFIKRPILLWYCIRYFELPLFTGKEIEKFRKDTKVLSAKINRGFVKGELEETIGHPVAGEQIPGNVFYSPDAINLDANSAN